MGASATLRVRTTARLPPPVPGRSPTAAGSPAWSIVFAMIGCSCLNSRLFRKRSRGVAWDCAQRTPDGAQRR